MGDTNAAVATTEALRVINPDYILKIGCVGGNSKDVHTENVIVPIGYFHSGSWITRSKIDNTPTSNAALWQSVFGNKPYQVNSENLGGQPYLLEPDSRLTEQYSTYLKNTDIPFVHSYVGGGNMWFFDKLFMNEVLNTQVPHAKYPTWVADMESYAIAYACHIAQKPFTGIYRVSNSDYYNEPYIPEKVAALFSMDFISKIAGFIEKISK